MFGLGKRMDDAGMMREDDRVCYVNKDVYIVMMQAADGMVECVAAYMNDEHATDAVKALKADGKYAWYRDVTIED